MEPAYTLPSIEIWEETLEKWRKLENLQEGKA